MPTPHSVYGVDFVTDLALDLPVASRNDREPELEMVRRDRELPSGVDIPSCYEWDGGLAFRFEDDIAFTLEERAEDSLITVTAPNDPSGSMRTRMYFLGPMLAYYLELTGVVALHASCAGVDGAALAFLSSSGGGKSNLAAAAMVAGTALIADDIVAVDVEPGMCVRLGPPQMRLWPSDIPAAWGNPESFPLVHPAHDKRRIPLVDIGRFANAPAPLRCLYLPERSAVATQCFFEPIKPSQALIELVRHSFSPQFTEIVGLQPRRLQRLAKIVETVPIRRMVYPDGKEHLSTAWHAAVEDFRALN